MTLKAVAPTTLPIKALPTDTVEIEGTEVPIRSLSRAEALHFSTAFAEGPLEERVAEAEVYLLVHGAGVDEEEARAWRQNTDTDTAGLLIDGILALSGMTPNRGEKTDDPKPSGSEPS